jgi:aspartate aminotransferase-like enzyme
VERLAVRGPRPAEQRAHARLAATTSTSFACDLRRWLQIMEAYTSGGRAYHATLPTDGLFRLYAMAREAEACGLAALAGAQLALGAQVRALLAAWGVASVAAPGFEAPGVVVCHTDDPELQNGQCFAAAGLQIAAGVPLQCDEPADFRSLRIGLCGLDKLCHVDRSVAALAEALDTEHDEPVCECGGGHAYLRQQRQSDGGRDVDVRV